MGQVLDPLSVWGARTPLAGGFQDITGLWGQRLGQVVCEAAPPSPLTLKLLSHLRAFAHALSSAQNSLPSDLHGARALK